MRKPRALTVFAITLTMCMATVLAIPPARAEILSVMSCTLSTPCLEWDNTGTGDAIKGVSLKGDALHGQTKFKSAGKTSGKAGVLGEDLSTSGNLNAGVSGVSTNGAGVTGSSAAYNGVQGFSSSGGSGVYGQTSSAAGFGIAGRDTSATHDNNGAGVLADGNTASDGLHALAYGANANAVYAFSQSASAIVANQGSNDSAPLLLLQHTSGPSDLVIEINGLPGSDVFHVDSSGGLKAGGSATFGSNINVAGSITAGSGLTVNAGLSALVAKTGASQTLIAHSGTSGMGNAVFTVEDSGANSDFVVADDGNAYVSRNLTVFGLVYTGGTCNSGCIVGGQTKKVVGEYAAAETEPTIEDNGEASLVDGAANVALDPKFVNVIDSASEYLVSVTPEGDCEGLYVASRGPMGFVVRELRHGHHSLRFEYRIVAKRTGVHGQRLPMMDAKRLSSPSRRLPATVRGRTLDQSS